MQQQAHARIATHYYHCDHLGTPLALIDANGQIAWAASLDPWGNVLDEYDPQGIGQPIRLPGQIHDLETGLYYNRHRYYDPQIGGYITQDPIGLEGGFNKFSYPKNPMEWTDPLGLVTTVVINRNGIGHVRVHVGSGPGAVLYDPGGSYRNDIKGSGDALEGIDANLQKFIDFQRLDGPKVSVITYSTTPEEEEKIKQRIDENGGCFPLRCVACTSEVLCDIGPFEGLGSPFTPGGLERALRPRPPSPFIPGSGGLWR